MNYDEYKKANKLEKVGLFLKLLWKYNCLRLESQELKDTIKEGLYKKFMQKLNEPIELGRLKEENKQLREERKALRKELKELKGEK